MLIFIFTIKLYTCNHGYISYFLDLSMFNIHIHNQTRNQHRLHPPFSSLLTYSISTFTTRLTTNHGYISYFPDLFMFNIHIHNQTHYQHWLHPPFSSLLTYSISIFTTRLATNHGYISHFHYC